MLHINCRSEIKDKQSSSWGGVLSLTVIIKGNGISNPGSNPEWGCVSVYANALGKGTDLFLWKANTSVHIYVILWDHKYASMFYFAKCKATRCLDIKWKVYYRYHFSNSYLNTREKDINSCYIDSLRVLCMQNRQTQVRVERNTLNLNFSPRGLLQLWPSALNWPASNCQPQYWLTNILKSPCLYNPSYYCIS